MRTWILVLATAVQLVCCNEVNFVDDSIPIVYEPTWMYKCVQSTTTGGSSCIRSELPQPVLTRNLTTFTSLDVCRTVCGRFGGLWPKPVTAALSMHTVKIHPNFLSMPSVGIIGITPHDVKAIMAIITGGLCPAVDIMEDVEVRFDLIDVPAAARELVAAMSRLVGQNLQAECDGNVTEVVETPVVVFISVKSEVLKLDWSTDEHYNLDVQPKSDGIQVKISAETVYGARHALETFTQLVAADRPDYSDQSFCSLRLVAGAKIRDSPAFKHRGFVLDTARHFIPMEDIKRTIDGMAASKLNVFHWHVTDSQSFPLESRRVPQFTRYGAYSPYQIYSTEEVRQLVKYAQIRGVRVVIEIDSPAHAGNGWQWGKEYGFGDLAVCVNVESWRKYCIQPPCGQLNPANPAVYRVLKDLYRDIAELLPEPALLHVGGDEVFFPCWNSVPEIIEYMTNKGYNTTSIDGFIQLWGEFHEKVLQLWDGEVIELGGTQQPVMIWSSELTQAHRVQRYLSTERYIIEVWEPSTSNLLQQLLQLGYRTVSIPKDLWYLDRGFWGTTSYSNWRKMYEYRLPRDEGMLGGEVAMWSEYVDEQGLDTRVWPRAAAVAERLWSNPSTSTDLAESRLQRLRDRLVQRGLRPDVLSPGWCTQHEGKCL